MVPITENQASDTHSINWVEKAVAENYIKYYDCSKFTNKKIINRGSVGEISKANWKGTDITMIIKSSILTITEIVNELKIQREVDYHPNILKFYGISRQETDPDKYSLVIEYADGGTLNSYLKEHFDRLEWKDKYQLALQLASTVECLHNEDIIHCDLHANNVLIHQGNIKLADFGLSKKMSEASSYSKDIHGVIPYVDPKCFYDTIDKCDGNQSYVIDTKSDIYSLGVLFWQLSSGRKPFKHDDDDDDEYDVSLAIAIKSGKREVDNNDTPPEYRKLYRACWADDPNKRPTIQRIIQYLKSMINDECNDEFDDIELSDDDVFQDKPSSVDDEFENLVISDFIIEDAEKEREILPYILKQANKSFNGICDSTDNIETIIDKLITLLIEMQDKKGYNFNETNQFINQCIILFNQTPNDIFNWLINNQTKSLHIFFLGFLYDSGMIVEKDGKEEAFKLFSKASEDNCSIAQVYLSKCYQTGIGTKINISLAITCLDNSIKNNSICGQIYLANVYREGIGIEVDLDKVFYYYKKAANNGNLSGLYYLGKCYQFGIGIEQNKSNAFELYKKSAEQENIKAQFTLGLCYSNGIGTKINKSKAFELYKITAEEGNYDKAQNNLGLFYESGKGTKKDLEKAFYWYQKAARNGNKSAQYNLGMCYEYGTGVEKDENEAFKWYHESAKQEFNDAQNNLGSFYENGKGIKKDLNEAIYWYKKSAEHGNKVAQYNLGRCCQYGIGTEKDETEALKWYNLSAEKGHISAQYQLGYCYSKGLGTKVNKAKAYELYKKSAERGNGKAQNNLGELYRNGEGIEKNLKEAIRWYQRAAKNRCELASFNLGECFEFGIGVKKNKVEAFEWYKKSAEKNDSGAQIKLGHLYANGIGTEKDLEKASYWYKKALDNGCQDAKEGLRNLLIH